MALKNMEGKICMVTGATSGIGYVTAKELARLGATVIVVGRNLPKGKNTVNLIKAATNSRNVDFMLADLSIQSQVRLLANTFMEQYPRLDVLVNNAGAVFTKRQTSADGIEMTFALNHLSYFLLTNLLLDYLKKSSGRIINVSSRAHVSATMNFDDLNASQNYNGWVAYCRSKLANILFTYELARRLRGSTATVNALHPGFVATNFGKSNGGMMKILMPLTTPFSIGPEEGALTSIYLASSPEVAGVSGKYFYQCEETPSSSASYDQTAAARLWKISGEMTGLQSVWQHEATVFSAVAKAIGGSV